MASLAVCVSTVDYTCDVTSAMPLSLDTISWHGDVSHLVENGSLSSVYVILQTSNVAGLQKNTAARLVVDRTPPVPGRVSVVTSDVTGDAGVDTQCQTSTEFLEVLVEGFQDEESDIDECQVALETTEGAADIRGFEPVTPGRVELLTGLRLPEASHVRAVARCSNKAGLSSLATSLPLAVSPGPLLSVLDGPSQSDLDYQTSLTSMGGRWLYSDPCPVVSAQWRLETLDGREVITFHDIPVLTTSFSSDAIDLQRDVTYVNVIKTVDALNRTRVSRSDGVAVRVEPPYPGEVRDGEDRDLDFQLSNTSLSVNWDHFGMLGSSDATQRIVRYEVGIGDGLSYDNGLSNIQSFTSVGLNISVTFTDLTLTSKDVTYFSTVRAYSEAGGMQEATSDGVKVGYDPEIHPGVIDLRRFSSSPSSLTFSWSPFTSDLGMAEYKVAVSNSSADLPNGTFFLKDWPELMILEPQPLTSVGLDSMVTLENLTLAHEQEYYVIVVGIDKTDKCGVATAGPVLVDVTPPEPGNVTVRGAVHGDAAFIPSSREVSVTWEDFQDPESGVTSCSVRLLSFRTCVEGDGTELAVVEVVGENRTSFFRSLDVGQIHRVDVTCSNGAREKVTSRSLPIIVDATPPLPGAVKVGWDWRRPAYVQNDTTSVKVSVAVSSGSNVSCQRESTLFPSAQAQGIWTAQGPPFSPGAVHLERGKIYVSVGYDDTLTKVQKGGMKSGAISVVEGNYTVRFRAAQADNVVTSYVFGLPDRAPAETFFYPSMENSSRTFSNDSSSSSTSEEFTPDFGFSLSVYGWSDNGTWWCLASVRDDVQAKWGWVRLPFDPTASEYDYTFGLVRDLDDMVPSWSIYVFMGGDVAQMFRGLRLPEKMALYLETVNNEGFAPPMDDPFAAAFTVAQISSVRVPLAPMPDCVYGAAFSDQDFGLKELWLGVTDDENATDSVSPMTLLHSFCRPCPSNGCTVGCDPDCTREASWQLLQLEKKGLTLTPGRGVDQAAESASDNVTLALDRFREMNYYVTVRAVNFAGASREVKSNRFMVDVTPPQFEFLSCTDPAHSLDEPVDFVGSNSSVGAFWECDEDVSAVTRYTIAVGTAEGQDDVYTEASVKTKTKVALQLTKEQLSDNQTYYVSVKAENSAGLSSTVSCNVTAELSIPELPVSLEDSTLYTSRDLYDIPVALTYLQDRVGVVLPASEDPKVLYYEWDVGTAPGGGALFRTVAVGTQGSTRLEVRDGELFINGQRRNDSLEQPRNISQLRAEQDQQSEQSQGQIFTERQSEGRAQGQPENESSKRGEVQGSEQGQGSDMDRVSQGDQRSGWVNGTAYSEGSEGNNGTVQSNGTKAEDGQSSKEDQDGGQTEGGSETSTTTTPPPQNFLRLEPGRCYFQTLRVVSRAHVSASTQPTPVCVKREQDRVLDLRNGSVTLAVSANTDVIMRERRSTSDRMDVFKVLFKGLDGAAVVGALNPSDLEQDYGSSAALDYRPFIAQDLSATAPCSRFLARRLVRYTGASLYMSPTPVAVIEGRIELELQNLTSRSLPPDNQYSPLVWHADRQKWIHWDELCPADTTTDCVIGEPGPAVQSESLSARDVTTTTLYRPLHVGVFEMRRSIQNSPPVLDTLSISGAEDSVLETKLVVEDEENDDVTFTLTSSGQNGVADVTTTGDLRYVPKKEFCGGDSLQVLVAEVNVPEGVTANRVTYDLSVQITCADDPPTLQMVALGQTVNALTSEEVKLTWRGMLTLMPTLASLGHFVLADPDLGDDLEIEYRQDENQQVILQVADVTDTVHGVDLSRWSGQTVRVFDLRMPRPSSVPGDLKLHVIGRDRKRLYSRALKVTVTFRDVLCSTGSCGKFSLSASARDEEKKFIDYVPPKDKTGEATVNETDSSHSSIQVNSTAVRLYLGTQGYHLDVKELREKLASLLAQRLGVSPSSIRVTLEASEPVFGASGSVTEVLMSVTVDGVPLSSARLADFVAASKSTLERELGVSVDRTIPTHLDKATHVRILMVAVPLAVVVLILAVAVVVCLIHRKGKRLFAWKLQLSKRGAKAEDTLVLQELDEEIDNLSKEPSQPRQSQGSGYFRRKEDRKEESDEEEELPRPSEDQWSSQQELVSQSRV